MYTLICGLPGINYTRIWIHGVYGQKVFTRIRKVGFEKKFRNKTLYMGGEAEAKV